MLARLLLCSCKKSDPADPRYQYSRYSRFPCQFSRVVPLVAYSSKWVCIKRYGGLHKIAAFLLVSLETMTSWLLLESILHFAYCGLVGNPHLTAKTPLSTSTMAWVPSRNTLNGIAQLDLRPLCTPELGGSSPKQNHPSRSALSLQLAEGRGELAAKTRRCKTHKAAQKSESAQEL